MSGTRKSTVLAELKRRGHRVIDTDGPGWTVETHTARGLEPVWDLDQIKALIDGHRTAGSSSPVAWPIRGRSMTASTLWCG